MHLKISRRGTSEFQLGCVSSGNNYRGKRRVLGALEKESKDMSIEGEGVGERGGVGREREREGETAQELIGSFVFRVLSVSKGRDFKGGLGGGCQ